MRQGFIKVAALTPKVKVADTTYNREQICMLIDEAQEKGAKILVFPELCITGYTCGDLFYQELLLREAKKELLQYADPYICKSANLAAMEFVYDKLKPQLYIGRSFTDSLERKGIFGIDSMPGQDVLGFAGCFGLLKRLLDFTQTQIEEK